MANQIQVEFDMICNTWDKCYELFDYLGNSSDALACLDKKNGLHCFHQREKASYVYTDKVV